VSDVPSGGDAGIALSLEATPGTTGTGPFTYAWHFGDGTTGSGRNVTHSYTTPGTYRATVTLTDSLGATANASLSVPVAFLLDATAKANTSSVPAGGSISFFANLTGGTAPYTYSWVFGDGQSSPLPSPSHVFGTPGSYTVELWVNDSAHVTAHASVGVMVEVSGTPSPGPTTAGEPWWFWVGLGAIVAIAVVGSVLLIRRPPP
jgi:PKD repeat protein